MVKRCEEPIKPALGRWAGIQGSGLTPLGEATQVGAVRLAPRSESGKIMSLVVRPVTSSVRGISAVKSDLHNDGESSTSIPRLAPGQSRFPVEESP